MIDYMSAFLTPERLQALIDEALKDPDIQKGLQESELTTGEIMAAVLKRKEEIGSTMVTELQEYNQYSASASDFANVYAHQLSILNGTANEQKYVQIPTVVTTILLYAFLISPFFGSNILANTAERLLYRWFNFEFSGLIVGTIIGIVWYHLFKLLLKPIIRMYFNLRKANYRKVWNQGGTDLFVKYQNDLVRAENLIKGIEANLSEKSIKEIMRNEINERIVPSYGTRLGDIQARGLGEVMDLSRVINTEARKKLDFLFENMPGGSIGIAGSRGAGKSTLIQTYCGANRIVAEMNGRVILPVMTSAPVHYEARDFILHLFSSACSSVLRQEGEPGGGPVRGEMAAEASSFLSAWWRSVLPTVRALILLSSIVLFCSSIVLWELRKSYHYAPQTGTLKKTDTGQVDIALTGGLIDTSTTKGKAYAELAKKTLELAKSDEERTQRSYISYYFASISNSESIPATCLTWAIASFTLWLILNWIYGRNQSLLLFISYRRRRSFKETDQKVNHSPMAGDADSWLKQIKFQQTFTTGWSGGLKLPFGAEGGVNRATTLSERQMSNPEIIAAFTAFLNSAAAKYQVIIGIDELDKLQSDESATQFLNEIKSIFGIPRCFFLISVSENAMNNFERRGLPFRDVFDSSFDSIVYVDYLDMASSHALLQRRVIGRPVPFFCLAYCFAGGLPRDTIRYFRDILRFSQVERDLSAITGLMVREEVSAKLRAINNSLRGMSLPDHTDKAFEVLFQLQTGVLNIPGLEKGIHQLQLSTKAIQKNIDDRTITTDCDSLIRLLEEVYSYLYYIATLWRLFSDRADEEKIIRLQNAGTFERVAQARQNLAVDFAVSRKIVQACRKQENMPALK